MAEQWEVVVNRVPRKGGTMVEVFGPDKSRKAWASASTSGRGILVANGEGRERGALTAALARLAEEVGR